MMSLPIIDGNHSYFIDDFADSCGWGGSNDMDPEYKYFNIIESVKWDPNSYESTGPLYVKLKPEYEC